MSDGWTPLGAGDARPASVPALTERAVHVWRVALDDEARVEGSARLLSADEHARAQRLHDAAHRRRFVLAHGGRVPDLAVLGPLAVRPELDILVAGGVTDLDGIRRLRDAGIAGIILGEALMSGAIDFTAALEAAA